MWIVIFTPYLVIISTLPNLSRLQILGVPSCCHFTKYCNKPVLNQKSSFPTPQLTVQKMKFVCWTNNKHNGKQDGSPKQESFPERRTATADDDNDQLTDEERNVVISALANQNYHIHPNNTWWQDWWQYLCNNHPIFSLCLHHPHHPVQQSMRWIGLLGSIVFGLAITNVVWLLFIYDDEHANAVSIEFSVGSVSWNNQTTWQVLNENNKAAEATTVQVNTGMLILWTIGAALHTLFDTFVWQVTSGLCCQQEAGSNSYLTKCIKPEYQKYGNLIVIWIVLLIAAFSTMIAVVRVTLDEEDGDVQDVTKVHESLRGQDTSYDIRQVKDASNYEFLLSYSVELAVTWLIYFPLFFTISFSGILACFKPVWCLGGRVYEIAQETKESASDEANAKEAKSGYSL